MNLNEYQQISFQTAVYPRDQWRSYLALALAGEAGELCNVLKKEIRSGNRYQDRVIDETGDLFWYCAAVCSEAGLTLEDAVKSARRRPLAAQSQETSMLCLITATSDTMWHLLRDTKDRDLIFFVSNILQELLRFMNARGIHLEDVLTFNLNKLQERSSTGTIKEHS